MKDMELDDGRSATQKILIWFEHTVELCKTGETIEVPFSCFRVSNTHQYQSAHRIWKT